MKWSFKWDVFICEELLILGSVTWVRTETGVRYGESPTVRMRCRSGVTVLWSEEAPDRHVMR